MAEVLITNVSIGVEAGSRMWFRVLDKGTVEFHADGDRGGSEFDVSFDVEALRRFIELGARAVADADARRTRNKADADQTDQEAEVRVS
jgi:hypothetical protein